MSLAIASGRAALQHADWAAAKESFERALAEQDSPEARDGLGYALWWLGDVARALEERERAFAAYAARSESREAARLALFMSSEYGAVYGNQAASLGWEARAERLLADSGPCAERVLILLRHAQRLRDPAQAATRFDEAMAMARSIGDRDLEIFALSSYGRALVSAGELDTGFAHLDEAMAATTAGELKDHWLVADTSCNMLIACDRVQDLSRATQWCQVAEQWARRHNCLPFFAFCRISYGGVLFARGRWDEAEDQFVDAARRSEATFAPLCAHANGKLVELRIAQGQIAEAASLIEPWLDHPACTCASAALEIARGELDAACSRLERRVEAANPDPSLLAPLCESLASVHVARGDRVAARASADRLTACAERLKSRVLTAMADGVIGTIEAATGAPEAVARLTRALDVYTELGMPYRAARVQLTLARSLAPKHRDAGVAAARAALSTGERLGAQPVADEAADILRELSGARPAVRRRSGTDALTPREREVLALIVDGLSNPLIAERLDISPKTAEHHVCSILAKLEVTTRAAAAAWAVRQSEATQRANEGR